MGHLLSRAIRRLTQCNSSSNQAHQRDSERTNTSDQSQPQPQETDPKPTVQSIPVGQSIDSAEYAAFEANNKQETKSTQPNERPQRIERSNEENASVVENAPNDDSATKDNENTPQVEEAVIKIQAYVRGHLTRKALKDAQHQNVAPSPNALGQSQFDEDSLTKSPKNDPQGGARMTTKLESIAEETQHLITSDKRDSLRGEFDGDAGTGTNLSVNTRVDTRDSVSPVPSEANASIDLNCDTPASASIDIMDHNIQPNYKMASVLHPKLTPSVSQRENETDDTVQAAAPLVIEPSTRGDTSPPLPTVPGALMSSHSIDSAEAAAIRIQSAFRGYHTRKHSPYRRRSPNSSTPPRSPINGNHIESNNISSQDSRHLVRQQDVSQIVDSESDGDGFERAAAAGRRHSRQRQRDPNQASIETYDVGSMEEAQLTDDTTIREACPPKPAESGPESRVEEKTTELTDDQPGQSVVEQNGSQPSATLNKSSPISVQENAADPPSSDMDGTLDDILRATDLVGTQPSLMPSNSVDIDTDSSNLGAALSLNEETIESFVEQGDRTRQAVERKASDVSDLDQSIGASLVVDSVDESVNQEKPTAIKIDWEREAALEEATEALEAALEEANYDNPNEDIELEPKKPQIDEEQRRAIELESDDIERRDPRGQASEQHPPMPMSSDQDQSSMTVQESTSAIQPSQESNSGNLEPPNLVVQDSSEPRMAVESPDEAFASGPPSPAVASSNGNSSSDEGEELDGQLGRDRNDKEQQSESQNQGASMNNSKNRKKNRNKKRGKK